MKFFYRAQVRSSSRLLPYLLEPKHNYWFMRVSLALVFVLSISASLLAIDKVNGQNLDSQITLKLKNASIIEAFKEIDRETGLTFVYDPNVINKYPRVSLPKERRTVKQTLELVLANTALVFSKVGDRILVMEPSSPPQSQWKSADPVPQRISGRIIDETTGEPIAGVNVIVKESTNGTTTDGKGIYTIEADADDILVFSFIGYKEHEEKVGNRTTIDLTLEEDAKSLEEITVNAGYWNVKDREKTGNISRIAGDDIRQQPVSNPLQGLQGRLPGVYIQQTTGVPGGDFKVMIRGQNSLRYEANDPLYIVDGIPFTSSSVAPSNGNEIISNGSPLTFINPNDIESIEVLKDADATAIYGSRGANGVVLITTKKASEGKPKIEVTVFQGFSKVPHRLKMLNTQQYVKMRKEGFRNDDIEEQLNPDYASVYRDLLIWDTTRYTDWQKELIGKTSSTTSSQASIMGGSRDIQYMIGGGYFRQTTVFPGNFSDQKISGHVNVNSTPKGNKFSIRFTGNYLFDRNQLPQADVTSFINMAPNAPALSAADGGINWDNSSFYDNPLQSLRRPYEGKTHNLITNVTIAYQILKGLRFSANTGFSSLQTSNFSALPIRTWDPSYGVNTATSFFATNDLKTWNLEPQLEFKEKIGLGELTILIGSTSLQTTQGTEEIMASDLPSDIFLKNIQASPTLLVTRAIDSKYRYQAIFARVNYTWASKYILNLTGRRDGSSRFGPNNQFANFGAIGIAWLFTNETLLSDSRTLSFGKLRASYGTTGSDQIGDYGYLNSYSTASRPYGGQTAMVPSRLYNPDYSWESNRKFEVGLELGFFDDRLFATTSYYQNQSSNQLIGYNLPNITGFNSVQANFPATVRNTGIEITLSSINLRNEKLKWQTSANLTFPRNKLLTFDGIAGSSYSTIYEVGRSLFVKKLFHSLGIDPATGFYMFEDKNGNGSGTDSPADRQGRKEISQRMFGGVTNSISYGKFELSFTFQFVKQTGYGYITSFPVPGFEGNQPVEIMNRWQKPGDITNTPRFTATTSSPAYRLSSIARSTGDDYVVNASFVRLQNIYFSWQAPAIGSNLNLKSKIFIQGQNVLTFTNFVGLDPETQTKTSLPPLRTFTAGIQLIF